MLAEPNFLSRDERERLCQLMFEVTRQGSAAAALRAVLWVLLSGGAGG